MFRCLSAPTSGLLSRGLQGLQEFLDLAEVTEYEESGREALARALPRRPVAMDLECLRSGIGPLIAREFGGAMFRCLELLFKSVVEIINDLQSSRPTHCSLWWWRWWYG